LAATNQRHGFVRSPLGELRLIVPVETLRAIADG
jgi:hypothetical protein